MAISELGGIWPPEPPYHFALSNLVASPLPPPRCERGRFNDAISIPHYLPSPVTYPGEKRRGVAEASPGASGPVDFADAAYSAIFPLAEPIPSPVDFADALDFAPSNSDGAISKFLRLKLSRLEQLATQFDSETAWRYSFCPGLLRPATGKLHLALCALAGGIFSGLTLRSG